MSTHSDFILFSSPPASGKTYWISEFASQTVDEILVISPLRALADECRHKWGDRIRVETPESWLAEQKTSKIVVFDEFHLLFYWGDTFRPSMWECFYALSSACELMVGLTATVSQDTEAELYKFRNCFDKMFWYDHGNQRLKNFPVKYLYLTSRSMMKRLIFQTRPVYHNNVQVFSSINGHLSSG